MPSPVFQGHTPLLAELAQHRGTRFCPAAHALLLFNRSRAPFMSLTHFISVARALHFCRSCASAFLPPSASLFCSPPSLLGLQVTPTNPLFLPLMRFPSLNVPPSNLSCYTPPSLCRGGRSPRRSLSFNLVLTGIPCSRHSESRHVGRMMTEPATCSCH